MANKTMTQVSVLVARWLANPTSLQQLMQQLLGEPAVATIKQVSWQSDTILPQCYSLAVMVQDDWGCCMPVQLRLVAPARQLPAALRHLTTLVTKARQAPQPPLTQLAVTFFSGPADRLECASFYRSELGSARAALAVWAGKISLIMSLTSSR